MGRGGGHASHKGFKNSSISTTFFDNPIAWHSWFSRMPRRGLTVTFAFQFRPCSLSPILTYFSHFSAFISYHVSSFCSFLSTTISAIGLVQVHYSPHSFRRGGAIVLPSSATFLHNPFIDKGIGKAMLI